MTAVLIGSRALNYCLPTFKIKEDTDWDIISEKPLEVSKETQNYEWHSTDILNNASFVQYAADSPLVFQGVKLKVLPMQYLASIKRSHLHRDLGFGKHITMYHKHLNNCNWKSYGDAFDLFKERQQMTYKEFPQGNPNLMQSKDAFFDDAVAKVYDHDYLHELFAYYDKPLYTRLLRDTTLAWCEESKWNTLEHDDKLKCIVEEVSVIATERFLVKNHWDYPEKLAYMKALQKVCTTLCSGWFRDYAIDYYPSIIELYSKEKFNKVKGVLL